MKHTTISKGQIIPFILLIFVAVAIAAATLVEDKYGSGVAYRSVYGAVWFHALWALVVLFGGWLICKRRLWKRPALCLLHVSFVIILLGAFTTHLTARTGMIHLSEGETTRSYWEQDADGRSFRTHMMPFYLCLDKFQVLYDQDGVTPADYVSHVAFVDKTGKRQATISMNHIGRCHNYRIYQSSYDDDLHGSVFSVSWDPWGTGLTYAGYLLLALSMMWYSLAGGRSKVQKSVTSAPRWSAWLLCLCGAVMASYMVIAIAQSPLVPVLRSPFLVVHVGTILVSYILLVGSLVERRLLRPAVFLLSAGIFLGAVWANVSWGTYWSWDPKESWALVTLIVYSLPLHQQSLPWLQSTRAYRIYSVIALLTLLMTYFGVNMLLGGMHSYAN